MTGPAFTCDHCSARVDLHADRCPSCGKVFEAVRCPKCGHQGPPRAFHDGCPKCRYLAAPRFSVPRRRQEALFVPTMAVVLVLFGIAAVVAWALRGG